MPDSLMPDSLTLPVPPAPPSRGLSLSQPPPPTPITLPHFCPQNAGADVDAADGLASDRVSTPHLTSILQALLHPADQVEVAHLDALGVLVNPNASLEQLIPSVPCLPPYAKWDLLCREDACAIDISSRPRLCNGKLAPGPSKYVDLRQSLLIDNERAFRVVRRLGPQPGERSVRLGYCHDFFRHLEALTTFWNDPSSPKPPGSTLDRPGPTTECHAISNRPAGHDDDYRWCRTSSGSAMPPRFRSQLLTSFLKLVVYDFSCNVLSRVEPRLYIKAPPMPPRTSQPKSCCSVPAYRHTYFTSDCNFIFHMPLDRDLAKSGIVEGPFAAVSPRHTTVFPPLGRERDSVIDLSREIIAALITAQHRAREGCRERRVGADAWWATKPRWGGGPGGPIGKEVEALKTEDVGAVLFGDKDERPVHVKAPAAAEGEPLDGTSAAETSTVNSSSLRRYPRPPPRNVNYGQPPASKRARKDLAMYDAYRMVRPPSSNWDPKTWYAAIGRPRGVDYDDVFVISSLFHHVSILRVRVPDRLLRVLDGSTDQQDRDWGKLEVWRTRWFDFFVSEDRVEAMKTVWGVSAYAMRTVAVGDGPDWKPSKGLEQSR